MTESDDTLLSSPESFGFSCIFVIGLYVIDGYIHTYICLYFRSRGFELPFVYSFIFKVVVALQLLCSV
ncbi:hypothetical protein K1719_018248 [Acacia pycnantha]|nr:hypothetical protein K1719_018248 [Acacia pycnantha]